jgi:hypothetical protein
MSEYSDQESLSDELSTKDTKPTSKSLWGNLSLVDWLGVISFPLGIWGLYLTYAFNKEIKPVYKVLSDVVITEGLPNSKIKVIYDSVEVKNVRVVTIALWNAGNEFIDKSAFTKDHPISISCDKAVGILEVYQTKTSRPDLALGLTLHIDDIYGTPEDTVASIYDDVSLEIKGDDGFEAQDGAVYQILYTTKATDYHWRVNARIKGFPAGFVEVEKQKDPRETKPAMFVSGIVVTMMGLLFSFMMLSLNKLPQSKELYRGVPYWVIINTLLAIFFLCLPLYIWYEFFTSDLLPNSLY